MIKCHVCGQGPEDGVSVFRQNAKGEPGVFACDKHSKPTDPATLRVVSAIEEGNR